MTVERDNKLVIDLTNKKLMSALGVTNNCSHCRKNIWGHTKEEASLCGHELSERFAKILKDKATAAMKAHNEGQRELAYRLTGRFGRELVVGTIELGKLATVAQNGRKPDQFQRVRALGLRRRRS